MSSELGRYRRRKRQSVFRQEIREGDCRHKRRQRKLQRKMFGFCVLTFLLGVLFGKLVLVNASHPMEEGYCPKHAEIKNNYYFDARAVEYLQ